MKRILFVVCALLAFLSYVEATKSYLFEPVTVMVEKIRAGELTSEELVGQFINQINLVNPIINAVVEMNPNALNDARELDEYFQREGKVKGRLHGIPVTIKEHIAMKGFHYTNGLMVHADVIATEDSAIVKRLKKEGAVILGTTNMMESGLAFDTENPIYGRTLNPYDFSRSPGGSSGGEGAIIAAGGSPLGFGSDLGGSVRVPAHNCGIMSIKPTTGRFSRDRTTPRADSVTGFLSGFVNFGPMARYISDVELALEVLSGPDSTDPLTYIPPYVSPPSPSVPRKVAFFTDDGLAPSAEFAVRMAVESAVSVLRSEGITVHEAMPEAFTQATDLMYRLVGYKNVAELGSILHTIETSPIRKVYKELKRLNNGISTVAEKEKLDDDILLYKKALLEFFEDYDAIILPPATFTALKPERTFLSEYKRGYSHFRWTYAWNVAQFPAMVVGSVYVSDENLPSGVQIVVPPFKEDVAFAIAKILEENIETVSSLRPKVLFDQVKPIHDEL